MTINCISSLKIFGWSCSKNPLLQKHSELQVKKSCIFEKLNIWLLSLFYEDNVDEPSHPIPYLVEYALCVSKKLVPTAWSNVQPIFLEALKTPFHHLTLPATFIFTKQTLILGSRNLRQQRRRQMFVRFWINKQNNSKLNKQE